MKKYSVVIAMVLVLALTASTFAGSMADVPNNHWAYEAVEKLVATGLIEGYPDGTFKGKQDLTRYEIAVVLSRLLDAIEDAHAELAADAEAMVAEANAGLSTLEAEQVQAILEKVIAENADDEEEVEVAVVEEDKLSEDEADAVAILIDVLTLEFSEELADLGVKVDDLEARVDALENAPEAAVSFSGEYKVNFKSVTTDGDGISVEEGSKYHFVDPYDTNSGEYVEDVDADTDDDSDDYRLTDGEDYYEPKDNELTNELDLNIAVNKGALSADLDMTAYKNVFGGDDDSDYDFDSVEGTITNGDFTATIKDEQNISFRDYIFDDVDVDGVVVDIEDDRYFVAKIVDTVKGDVTVKAGEDDEYYEYDREVFVAGAKTSFDLALPVDVYLGYEYAGAFDPDLKDGDTADVTKDEIKKALVGLETGTAVGDFDVTGALAFNPIEGANGRMFRLGATGAVEMLDLTFNYENTKDMVFIRDDASENKEGYDFEVATTLGVVDGSVKYEDYGTTKTTLKASVAEGKVTLGDIAVDGSYELETTEDNKLNEIRKINASTDLSGLALTYAYEYDVDNDAKDVEKDRLDNGNNLDYADYDTYNDDQKDEFAEKDEDVNKHTIEASYAVMEEVTAGFKAELEKDVADDSGNKVIFVDEFSTKYTLTADYAKDAITAGFKHVIDGDTTLTGRYTQDMYEAGFEKVLDGKLVIDGKVTAPEMSYAGFAVNADAAAMYNVNSKESNLEVNADLSKALSDALTLTAGFGWADKAIDVDNAGQKTTASLNAEYKVSEDITANAGYEYLKFDGDVDYNVNKATAGVSVAF